MLPRPVVLERINEALKLHPALGVLHGHLQDGLSSADGLSTLGRDGPLEGPWAVTLGIPNRFGLYGIAANIHEWFSNWHDRNFYATSPTLNPIGPEEGRRRSSRGGAWRHTVTMNRTAARSSLDPSFRYTDYGFRLARSV